MASSDMPVTDSTVPYDTDTTPAEHCEHGCSLIQEMVETAGAERVVVSLSGGIDSPTTATFAVETVRADNAYGLCPPTLASTDANMHDAQMVATDLGATYDTIRFQPVLNLLENSLASKILSHGNRAAIANVADILRISCGSYSAV